MMQPCFIYALCEPDDSLTARYIGQTPVPEGRLRQHIETPLKSTRQWIESLLSRGKRPVMVLLAEIRMPEQFDAQLGSLLPEGHKISSFFADKMTYASEKCTVEHFHLHEPGELLNVSYKPKRAKAYWAKQKQLTK
jgi:hypothetical protein